MAKHMLGRRPAKIFCKVNPIAKKTTAKSVDAHIVVGGCLPFPYDVLPFPYHALTTRLPNLQQDVRVPSGDCWWLHTIPIRCPCHFLTTPLPLPDHACHHLKPFLICVWDSPARGVKHSDFYYHGSHYLGYFLLLILLLNY